MMDYTYLYLYLYLYLYVYLYLYLHLYKDICTCTCICVYICTCFCICQERHFQEPIPHLDEGLNNKEMNEQLLNYLTCGDVHPNVLGQYIFWGNKVF